MYQMYVHEYVPSKRIEEDIQEEYQRQRDYLERTVDGLKRKLHKEMELHKRNSARLIQENVALVKEINELRKEAKVGSQEKALN